MEKNIMDFQQLAYELNNYCSTLLQQVAAIYALAESGDSNAVVMNLDTSGLDAVDEAINTETFLQTACRSLNEDYQYKQCTKGVFAFSNELIGLKNSVTMYNNVHVRIPLHMVTSDCQYINLYVHNLL